MENNNRDDNKQHLIDLEDAGLLSTPEICSKDDRLKTLIVGFEDCQERYKDQHSYYICYFNAVALFDQCYQVKDHKILFFTCLYLSEQILLGYDKSPDFIDYKNKFNLNKNLLYSYVSIIMKKVNGILLRPNLLSYTTYLNEDLINSLYVMTCMTEIMNYLPSDIFRFVETIESGRVEAPCCPNIFETFDEEIFNLQTNAGPIYDIKDLEDAIVFTVQKALDFGNKMDYASQGNNVRNISDSWKEATPCHLKINSVGKKIGSGQSGDVYEVNSSEGNLVSKMTFNDTKGFLKEITALFLLKSDYIVNISCYDFNVRLSSPGGNTYLEKANNNLFTLIQKDLIGPEDLIRFSIELGEAISYTHYYDICHADLKSENVLIKDNTIKLADYGTCFFETTIVPILEEIQPAINRAPEVYLKMNATKKVDIWGYGCIIAEMLLRTSIFMPEIKSETEVLKKIFDILGDPVDNEWEEGNEALKQAINNYDLPFDFNKYTIKTNKTPERYYFDFEMLTGRFADILLACFTLDPNRRSNANEVIDMLKDF